MRTSTPLNLSSRGQKPHQQGQSLEDSPSSLKSLGFTDPFAVGFTPQAPTFLVGAPFHLPEAHLSLLIGFGGEGKSSMAAALAIHVATGRPFLGADVRQTKVLYLDCEAGEGPVIRAFHGVARGHGISFDDARGRIFIHSLPSFSSADAFLDKACSTVEEEEIGLVILDAFQSAFPKTNPIKAEEVMVALKRLHRLTEHGATVLILDHRSKGERLTGTKTPFGSSYKANVVRNVSALSKVNVNSPEGETLLEWEVTKANLSPCGEVIGIRQEWDVENGLNTFRYTLTDIPRSDVERKHRAIRTATLNHLKEKVEPVPRKELISFLAKQVGSCSKTVQRVLESPGHYLKELEEQELICTVQLPGKGSPKAFQFLSSGLQTPVLSSNNSDV